jgi:hypothetical protein
MVKIRKIVSEQALGRQKNSLVNKPYLRRKVKNQGKVFLNKPFVLQSKVAIFSQRRWISEASKISEILQV